MKHLIKHRNLLIAAIGLAIGLASSGQTQWFVAVLTVGIMVCNSFDLWVETQTQTPLSFSLSDPELLENGAEPDDFFDEVDMGGFWDGE